MRISIYLSCCLLLVAGCREWEMRKDPDLWRIDPREKEALHSHAVSSRYVVQVTDRTAWQVHSSLSDRSALYDGDETTVATSGTECRRGAYILVDLGELCCFQRVSQECPGGGGLPARFRIDTAGEHGFPFVLQFVGSADATEATLPRPVHARFVRITAVDDSPSPWSVAELHFD